jgi:tRNA(fMet)-specific endonuclease VapC
MRYLLDTNTVIAVLKSQHCAEAKRLRQYPPHEISVSSVVMHELFYGAYKSQRIAHNLAVIAQLQFEVVELDQEDAQAAGQILAHLANQGAPIGPYDVLIAGQAFSRGLTLVTHNVREFARVTDLLVEDWHD